MKVIKGLCLVVLGTSILTGCLHNDKPKVENQIESTTSTVIKEEEIEEQSVVTELKNTPEYFVPKGWIDKDRIVGLAKNQIVIYNVAAQTSDNLAIDAWNFELAPNSNYVAYEDEAGIWVTKLFENNTKLVWKRNQNETENEAEGGNMQLAFRWGTNANTLIISHVYEWDGEHYLVDLDSNSVTKLNSDLKNYFLTFPVGWLDQDTIIFETRAAVKTDGTREYSFGYRGDLATLNIQENKLKLLTKAVDGQFYQFKYMDDDKIVATISSASNTEQKLVTLDSEGKQIDEKDLEGAVRFLVHRNNDKLIMLEQYLSDNVNGNKFIVKDESNKTICEIATEAILSVVYDDKADNFVIGGIVMGSKAYGGVQEENKVWMIRTK